MAKSKNTVEMRITQIGHNKNKKVLSNMEK